MRIHHVTAIAGEPQRNLDFYAGLLGMRLVKLTVNYDDPGTYHFYYGDELGRPGTLLTFFPWPGSRPGRQGTGQINGVALAIPQGSLGYWVERLLSLGVTFEGPTRRFGEQVLALADPDGLMLELVATPRVAGLQGWPEGSLPAEHAIRGVHGVTIWEDGDAGSADFLTDTIGYAIREEAENRIRLESGSDGLGTVVELRRAPGFWRGGDGAGTVHHVAFRAPDEAEQVERQRKLRDMGVHVTDVRDRTYFRSIYFREPGGVLFEIATDGPGFTVDESPAELGTALKLPARLENMRQRLEVSLPPLHPPHTEAVGG
ncbi:MAG TPA: ring-cleaving dioxygenase [Gemmatimonadales bacterium]|jgi:catechol 2,3-dioxygenase-like lactoylglutathione lyase family enzyme